MPKDKKKVFTGLFRDLARLLGAKSISHGIALLALPLVSQIYNPAAVGTSFSLIAVSAIIGAGAGLGYQFALPIAKRYTEVKVLLSAVIVFTAIVALLASTLGAFFLNIQNYPKVCYFFLGIIVLFNSYVALNIQLLVRDRDYATLSLSFLVLAIITYGSILLFGFCSKGPSSFLSGYALGVFSQASFLSFKNYKYIKIFTNPFKKRSMAILSRWKDFPKFTAPTVTLNAAGTNMTVLASAFFYTSRDAGILSIAEKISLAPVSLLGQSFSYIYVGEMSKAIRHAPHKILKIFQTALCLSLMPAIGISLIFYFGAGIFVKSFFSSSWGDVSIILRYFSVLVAFRLIASCISRVFAILEHQKIAFLWNVLRLLSVFLVFFSGKTFSFSFKESIYILCLVLSINDCLVIFLAYRVVLERSRRERYKLDRKFQVDMT